MEKLIPFPGESNRFQRDNSDLQSFDEKMIADAKSARLKPDATPPEKFDWLVGNLRRSMQTGMVSFVDSDAFVLTSHLEEHPELSTSEEELAMRLDILGTLVNAAWKHKGWEDALVRLHNPRLGAIEDPLNQS